MDDLRGKKRGQVTIFIIIAILVVAGVVLFFTLRGDVSLRKVPENLEPVYDNFQVCVESNMQEGIILLERQGGYIYLPEYRDTVGPFSSWLYFSGNSIPYWSYTRGGVEFEQVPTEEDMERDLEKYLQREVQGCSFQEYEEQGFSVEKADNVDANVDIQDNNVDAELDFDLSIEKEGESVTVSDHEISVDSSLGDLHDSAMEIYEKEKQERFLEEYGIDILRLYAPVDGFELRCSPLVWNADNVFNDLGAALETNTMALSSGGRFQNKNEYFNPELDIDNNARFLNSQNWEHSFEVVPSEGDKLISESVGNNQALGALGFCYNAYHFVYDMKYPVLVQVYDSESPYEGESFQFPVGVVIRGNQPREPLNGSATGTEETYEVCEYRNTNMTISTYDREEEPVDSRIMFSCLDTQCYVGETGDDGILDTQVPQCINGQIIAEAEDFNTAETTFSTVEGGSVNLYMDPLYELDLEVLVNGQNIEQYSDDEISKVMISFDSEDSSETIVYPQEEKISLSEGQYSVTVHVYGNTSMSLDQTNSSQQYCLDVSDSIAGNIVPGQKCFEIDSPNIINSNALVGGGKKDYYMADSQLRNSENLVLSVDKFEKPDSLGKLQRNYDLLETKQADISLT